MHRWLVAYKPVVYKKCIFTAPVYILATGSLRNIDVCLFQIFIITETYVMFCVIWYHLYYLKNVLNTHGGVLLLVKLQAFHVL